MTGKAARVIEKFGITMAYPGVRRVFLPFIFILLSLAARQIPAAERWVFKEDAPQAKLIIPTLASPMEKLVLTTLNGYLQEFYGRTLPADGQAAKPGLYIVIGNEHNNPVIRDLVAKGLKLNLSDLGDEGFAIETYDTGNQQYVIIAANTPLGLKYGCQEIVFFHMPATLKGIQIDWPLQIRRKPQFGYRGIYMLPCWAAHDSLESWQRVLKFNSELTLNRIWFWLNGFPLIEEYGGEYKATDLSDVGKVRGLVDFCRSEGMKFYIGGGWFTWHHKGHAGSIDERGIKPSNPAYRMTNRAGSIERGIKYYRDMVKLLPGTEGIYLEPPGEGYEIAPDLALLHTEALATLMQAVRKERPDFEFAIAIGEHNNPAYRQAVHRLDDKRTYFWWCWGDPLRDNALAEHPLILRWHTIWMREPRSEAPRPDEVRLTGFATSYDPGMGFGNAWNGWGKCGVDKPRNFDPHTIPYFSHEYLFRERCWDVNIKDEEFADRLSRRLFDADMPEEAIREYLKLAGFCANPKNAPEEELKRIETFVNKYLNKGTSRNRDTIRRMEEALAGIKQVRAQKK